MCVKEKPGVLKKQQRTQDGFKEHWVVPAIIFKPLMQKYMHEAQSTISIWGFISSKVPDIEGNKAQKKNRNLFPRYRINTLTFQLFLPSTSTFHLFFFCVLYVGLIKVYIYAEIRIRNLFCAQIFQNLYLYLTLNTKWESSLQSYFARTPLYAAAQTLHQWLKGFTKEEIWITIAAWLQNTFPTNMLVCGSWAMGTPRFPQ